MKNCRLGSLIDVVSTVATADCDGGVWPGGGAFAVFVTTLYEYNHNFTFVRSTFNRAVCDCYTTSRLEYYSAIGGGVNVIFGGDVGSVLSGTNVVVQDCNFTNCEAGYGALSTVVFVRGTLHTCKYCDWKGALPSPSFC